MNYKRKILCKYNCSVNVLRNIVHTFDQVKYELEDALKELKK